MIETHTAMTIGFAKIDARMELLQSALETRIERGCAGIVKWVVGVAVGSMVSFITVITFVLNHAS